MKKTFLIAVIICLLLFMSSCVNYGREEPIVGEWTAAGVLYKGQVYSFEDVPALASLYDFDSITINKDETFSQLSYVFIYEGSWETLDVKGYDYAYLLQSESVHNIEGEYEASDRVQIAYIMENDPNLLMISDADEKDEYMLIFLRKGTTSDTLS